MLVVLFVVLFVDVLTICPWAWHGDPHTRNETIQQGTVDIKQEREEGKKDKNKKKEQEEGKRARTRRRNKKSNKHQNQKG